MCIWDTIDLSYNSFCFLASGFKKYTFEFPIYINFYIISYKNSYAPFAVCSPISSFQFISFNLLKMLVIIIQKGLTKEDKFNVNIYII